MVGPPGARSGKERAGGCDLSIQAPIRDFECGAGVNLITGSEVHLRTRLRQPAGLTPAMQQTETAQLPCTVWLQAGGESSGRMAMIGGKGEDRGIGQIVVVAIHSNRLAIRVDRSIFPKHRRYSHRQGIHLTAMLAATAGVGRSTQQYTIGHRSAMLVAEPQGASRRLF